MNTDQLAAEAAFRVEHYAVLTSNGELVHRFRTLDLAKRVCKTLNLEVKAAIEKATKELREDLKSCLDRRMELQHKLDESRAAHASEKT